VKDDVDDAAPAAGFAAEFGWPVERHARAERPNSLGYVEPGYVEPGNVETEYITPAERLAGAVATLERLDPALSAKSGLWRGQRAGLILGATAILGAALAAPSATSLLLHAVLAAVFALLLSVRVLALRTALGTRAPPVTPRTDDHELPVYTVLVALYREAEIVPQLVRALTALDYPEAKLDIIFALEDDDRATRDALLAQDQLTQGSLNQALPAHMRVVCVPAGQPRTKPRALCYAASLARGDYVVVFDAEDLPDPDQLRRAAAAFAEGGANLGCLQASLAVNNAHASWLTTQFAIEYTALFDAVLPALARHGLPVPLGGTSNHFPRSVLEAAGGWDPYNVTEDADLGLRLARFGWRVEVLASTTWEEAPATWRTWVAQRTRWQKGWMQTYFVHMRQPARLWREVGPVSWSWFQIVLGGGILSALAHPFFYALLIWRWSAGRLAPPLSEGVEAWLWWIGLANLTASALATIVVALLALERRGRRDLFAHALLSPLYWLPISYAAYRALIEWYRAPFYWAKTPHGGAITPNGGGITMNGGAIAGSAGAITGKRAKNTRKTL
jgi:glycosyltransferase XagB